MFSAFQELLVYQRAAALADDLRAAVREWDSLDVWSSGIQLVRAADSITANIAEATGRHTFREQLRFYVVARGSLHEVHHWLLRAEARELALPRGAETRGEEIGRMLNGLITTTRSRADNRAQNQN